MMPISPEVRKAQERFTKEAKEVLRLFKEKVEGRTSPGTVHHYTDDVGLSGILETGKLRLSNLFKLNDPSELRHGLSIASDILKTRALREPLAKLSADFHSYLETELQSTGHYFVCSFSSDGNDLGQWRAYADNGRGYALGFDLKALEKAFANPDEGSPPLHLDLPHHLL
ncbi:MAG TPA: DUF2971 domain-containing protein [Terriglobales bacterium]|nr:DUF2971 domain-containing protein [Terriglobales bacterium]